MKGSKIFKAAFIVMIISIISRFLGLFRDMLVSYQFGMNMYTDAYKAAVSVPETVFTIVGLAISTVFIPMLSKVTVLDRLIMDHSVLDRSILDSADFSGHGLTVPGFPVPGEPVPGGCS